MLTISREDVDRYFITDFSASERFIKLPIVNYLKLAPSPNGGGTVYDNINRPQIALINAINSPKYRFVCAALSRRLGKTFISNIIGQLVALVPGCNVLIMSPNFSLSSISFELQRRLIKNFDLEVAKDNLKDKVIELSNGSTIRMGSLSTVDSCVGRSYDLIIFDEAALGKDGQDAFNVSLRPTLDRPNSKAIFISTPRGKNNWFSVFFHRGFSAEFPEWCSITADWTENDRMTPKDVEEAKKSMSKAEFEQEYMASFNSFEGQIYAYKDEYTVPYDFSSKDEFIAGLDPGYRDETGFVVIAFNPDTQIFHIVDEYLKAEATTDKHAASFHKLIEQNKVDAIFIDSSAAQMAADLAYIYDITTIRAKKDVLPGIAYIQTLVETGRIRVAPHCAETLRMFDQYQWDTREQLIVEKPLHTDVSHIADALRYAIYTYTL